MKQTRKIGEKPQEFQKLAIILERKRIVIAELASLMLKNYWLNTGK